MINNLGAFSAIWWGDFFFCVFFSWNLLSVLWDTHLYYWDLWLGQKPWVFDPCCFGQISCPNWCLSHLGSYLSQYWTYIEVSYHFGNLMDVAWWYWGRMGPRTHWMRILGLWSWKLNNSITNKLQLIQKWEQHKGTQNYISDQKNQKKYLNLHFWANFF